MAVPSISPIENKDRIQVIDILRGIALLGIIMVNVHEISYSWYVTEVNSSALDKFAQFITDTFFLNKFYTLFSFLFGLGMSLQMIRAEQKRDSFAYLYIKRLFWLLIFGLFHAIFIWDGDILATYAWLGVFLLLLRKLNPKVLIVLAIVLVTIQTGLDSIALNNDKERWTDFEYQNYKVERQNEVDFYRNASYVEITAYRIEKTLDLENPWQNVLMPYYALYDGSDILGMFLFGLAVGKLGWFNDIDKKSLLWRKIFCWAFPTGLSINVVGGYLAYLGATDIYSTQQYVIGQVLTQLGAAPLTLGYISGIVLLRKKTEVLAIFAPAGKTAMTVYLTQSIILTLIFYSYGLGLFNTIGMAFALLLALIICSFQVLISNIWMRYFRFGPFEWLWRSLTYQSPQPMKR
jgi:uncharacterized protein